MRNLKKFLALVLAMMMVFSLMVTANATTFKDDADISEEYVEAAEVLQALGVYRGEGGNTMNPKGDFNRAYLAGIAYRVGSGDVDDDQTDLYLGIGPFGDVPESNWANAYVNYVYIAEWIHGETAITYNPGGKVTGFEVLAILLQILG